jgi:hypothetical protein
MDRQAVKNNATKQRLGAFSSLMDRQAVKNNATKQRLGAFSSLMDRQAVKNNATKQRLGAFQRFGETVECSSPDFSASHFRHVRITV